MEEILFNKLCSIIPEKRLTKLVDETVKNSKEKFCVHFKHNVQKEFPGFRNIQRVPIGMLCKKIERNSQENINIAQTLLSEWYNFKTELVSKIKEKLNELAYNCKEPDFSSLSISYEFLSEKHSIFIKNLSYVDIFDEEQNEETMFEITLISILLGWYPNIKEKNMQGRNSPSNNDILSNPIDLNIDVMIKQLKTKYDSLIDKKELLKSNVVRLLESIKSEQIILSDLEKNCRTAINNYNESHSEFINIASKIFQLFGNEQLSFSEETLEPIKLDLNSESLYTVKQGLVNYYEKYIELSSKLIEDKIKKIRELILHLESVDQEGYEKKLDEIKNNYPNQKSVENLQKVLDLLLEMEISLRRDIESYNLETALDDFELKNSKRAEKYILDFFISNKSTTVDRLIFFLFTLPGSISLSIELKESIIKDFLEFLSKRERAELVAFISKDSIHRVVQETEEGKKLLIILAILLYAFNKREIAADIIYIEGIYESVSAFNFIRQIVGKIFDGEDLKFYESKKEELNKTEELLSDCFNKKEKYQEFTLGIEKKYKVVIEDKILIELKNIYEQVKANDVSKSQNLINKISAPKFPEELYKRNKTDLPKNYALEKKIEKFIEKIIDEIKTYFNLYKYEQEFINQGCLPSNYVELELKELFSKTKILKPFEKTTLEIFNDFKLNQEKLDFNSSTKYENNIASLILDSIFYAKHCAEILIKINETELTTIEFFENIKSNLKNNPDLTSEIEKLKNSHCFRSLEHFRGIIDKNELKGIDESKRNVFQEIEELEKFLKDNNKNLPENYIFFKTQGRFKYCKNILMELKKNVSAEKKKTSELLWQKFNDLQKISAQTRVELINEKDKFSEHAYNLILEALKILDEISQLKKEHRIVLADELLKEIKHLRQFNNESLDQLINLIKQYSEDDVKPDFENLDYLNITLKDIIKYIENDDYSSLGLTKHQWQEISSERKEYILDLIKNWIYLQDEPSTKEDIQKKNLDIEEIKSSFSELLKNLFSICSLYKTNDSKKIGQDPLQDWNYSTDLPFTFMTKLQSPRCSSLDKPIHFYVLTKQQTSSKKYIIRIKDFISEKQNDQTAFNVIVLLDDKNKFDKINTYSLTKNLPILDEYALKRIIFSVSENRLPKWQFVSLLTLNNKISTIQPFKTQGSVDNNTGIFVGRNDIIKEITSSQKDFAIYGGRKIGKSSLLSVISENLVKNGYVISLQSFQGIDNPHTVAKSILEDLKNGGLNSSSLIKIDSLDEFSFNLLSIYRENESRKVAIILDEMDELIHKEKKVRRHQIIEIFRNISTVTNHKWRFIFAGFKEMYLEIHGKGVYEHWKNPWQNFVDDSNMQLSEIESPRELIDEGLKDILGLEYEKDIINLITEYSTGHPAFLQKFCECLVKSIDNRISLKNRRVFEKDVRDVFEKDTEFINFVKSTLDLNLSTLQELITVIAAMYDKEIFRSDYISNEIKSYINLFEKQVIIKPEELDLQLELLTITGIIKRTINKDEFRFTHPYYIKILRRIETIDKNLIENLINKICVQDEI